MFGFRRRRRREANETVVEKTSTLPPWVAFARKYIGTSEFPGKKHNPVIVGWWEKISRPYRDDETPYCGAFVGFVMHSHGFTLPEKPEGARQWLKFGIPLRSPVPGCVVVFWRGSPNGWAGHVAIVTGVTPEGNLMCVGANQRDTTSEVPFAKLRVLGYRWPSGYPIPDGALDVVNTDKSLSDREE